MFCLHLSAGYRFISWIALSTLWTAGPRMAPNVRNSRNFHYSRACVDKVSTCWRTKVWRNQIENANIVTLTATYFPRPLQDRHAATIIRPQKLTISIGITCSMTQGIWFIFQDSFHRFRYVKVSLEVYLKKKIVRINNVAHAANFRGSYWSISAFHRLFVNCDVRFGSKNRNLLF